MTDSDYAEALAAALANPVIPEIWRERIANGEKPPLPLLLALASYHPDTHLAEAINRRQEFRENLSDEEGQGKAAPLLLDGTPPSAYEVITRQGVVAALWELVEELANDEEQLEEAIAFGSREEQEALVPLLERLRAKKERGETND